MSVLRQRYRRYAGESSERGDTVALPQLRTDVDARAARGQCAAAALTHPGWRTIIAVSGTPIVAHRHMAAGVTMAEAIPGSTGEDGSRADCASFKAPRTSSRLRPTTLPVIIALATAQVEVHGGNALNS